MKYNKDYDQNEYDILYDLYINKKMLRSEIAVKLNIPEYVVSRRLGFYKINKKKTYGELSVDIELLKKLYVDENKSLDDVAKITNFSKTTLKRVIAKYDLHKTNEQAADCIKNSLIRKYDCDTIIKIPGVKEKIEKTNLEKYGYTTVLKNDNIRNKIRQTNLERYGTEIAASSSIVREKIEKTFLDKYGSKYIIGLNEIKDKIKQTNLEKYGCEYIGGSSIIKNKIIKTNIERYGAKSPIMNSDIREKIKQTNLEKYGFTCCLKNPEIHKKSVDTFKETYKKSMINKTGFESSSELIMDIIKKSDRKLTIQEIADKSGYATSSVDRIIILNNLYNKIDLTHFHSTPETEIADYIKSLGITNLELNTRNIIPPMEIDIYLPDYKIGIEYNGTYWHSSLKKDKHYHEQKSLLAEKNGIRLIHIYEYEWNDINLKNKIKSLLKIALNKTNTRIYARNCDIRKITNQEARDFNNKNHLQNHRNAQITYGLFYKDQLVQLMSFSHHRKYDWEIVRGCPGSNNVVVGGVGKLFKHFIKEYNPNQIFSYCDFNKFDGNSYLSIGMKFVGYTGPDKTWLVGDAVVKRSASNYHKYKDIATAVMWGAGSKKYLWTKKNTEN